MWCKLACERLHHSNDPALNRMYPPVYCTTTVMVVLCDTVPEVAVSVKL